MIAVLQRVSGASCLADGTLSGEIGKGLFILLGVVEGDTEEDVLLLSEKISKLRIFTDSDDKMNLSLVDVGGGALVVSNFTLAANYKKGTRPDYLSAAHPSIAEPLYESFCSALSARVSSVEKGVFGAHMEITATLCGPVTIVMDSALLRKGGKQ